MPSFSDTTRPRRIVEANPRRNDLKITNLSDTMVYVAKFEVAERFTERAWPIKQYGVFEIETNTPHGYKGPIFALVSAESDIRIWET